MNLGQALDQAAVRLKELDNPTARFDAEVLLRHVLDLHRVDLLRQLNKPLGESDAVRYSGLVERLAAGEPLQYLTGQIEFYGLEFYVNSSVLIPRPETELLVEKAIQVAKDYPNPAIADVGCGSGAVAVTLARNLPNATMIALDISHEALDLARHNASRHDVANIEFIYSNLLDAVADRHIDIICANLPYVPTAEAKANRFEPQLALEGGIDGLDVIRRLVHQIADRQDKPGWLLLEFGTGQAAAVKPILDGALPGSRTSIYSDLIPLDRVSLTKLPMI